MMLSELHKSWIAALLVASLSACDGGSSSGAPASASDSASGMNDPLDPPDVTFVGQEDADTTGSLPFGDQQPGERPVAPQPPFTIQRAPEFGEVSVLLQSESAPLQAVFVYTPDADFFGSDRFDVRDATGVTVSVLVRVQGINDPPSLDNDVKRVVAQGDRFFHRLKATDVDDDTLRFTADNLPAWLMLDPDSGVLSGIPGQDDVGLFENIRLRVHDPAGLVDELFPVTVEVIDINDPPTINKSQFPQFLDAGERATVNVFPDDLDGDGVVIEVEPNDFVQTTVDGGVIDLLVADVPDVITVNLVVIATDRRGLESREIVPLRLHPLTPSGAGRTLRGRQQGEGLHLVILGDGYREDQRELFREHAENLIELMQSDPGVATHLGALNIHTVTVDSVDAGADDNIAFDFRDTAFGSGYFCLSIQRLICADQSAMFDVALSEYPQLDQLVLLVNDPRFGGSGGNVAIASAFAPEVALHEMGHSIAGLADEYVDAVIPPLNPTEYLEGRFANVSTLSDPAEVPWHRWIEEADPEDVPTAGGSSATNTVGVFTGAFYQSVGFFRPTADSRMRSFSAPFGPVNSEQWVLGIYGMTNPIQDFSPVRRQLEMSLGESRTFTVHPLLGEGVQNIEWRLDNQLIASGADAETLVLTPAAGRHQLSLRVRDISGLIRTPSPHAGDFAWSWDLQVR